MRAIGGVVGEELRKRFGTPLYVYDASVVSKRSRELLEAFPGMLVHYAVKANANPALLKIIKEEGLGAEAVSPGELLVAEHAGFKKKDISFTGPSLTEAELRFVANRAGRVHLDSLTQLETWGRLKLGSTVSLRLNLGIGAGHHAHVKTGGDGSKFGIVPRDIPHAKERAARHGLAITGLQQHIGSHVPDGSDYIEGAAALLKAAREFPDVVHVDFGGGFGVPYRSGEKQLNLKRIGREVLRLVRNFERQTGRSASYALEPGRFPIAEAGYLLVSVTDRKETAAHTFIGVDSGFNHLIRPALYGAHHEIENMSRMSYRRESVTIAGNICESGDVFAWNRGMPVPKIGDILAIKNAGAYGISMASTYNLRALPQEILIKNGKVKDITFDRFPFLVRL